MADLGLLLVVIGYILGIASGDKASSTLGVLGWIIILGGIGFIVEGVHEDTLNEIKESVKIEVNK